MRQRIFASLAIRNYRLYFLGQAVSLCGTWMQSLAQSWLVLQMTGSGTALGTVVALQFLPMLIFPAWFGVVIDRFPKRKILYVTQASSATLALILGGLVILGEVHLWMVYVLALALGLVNAMDNPARQAFVAEMAGPEHLANAIALNSTEVSLARVIGPALGGWVISAVGIAACFVLNGLSFLAVLLVLYLIRPTDLRQLPLIPPKPGQILQGLRYAWITPKVRTVLLMMALVGTLTLEFTVSLPLVAQETLHGDAAVYATLMAWLGVGAVIASLYAAGQERPSLRLVASSALFLGLSMLVMATSPNLLSAIIAATVVGFFSTAFSALGNMALQLATKSRMRGRVMSLWTVAFLGTSLIGGPLVGWVGEIYGARWGLALGGIAAVLAALYGYARVKRRTDAKPLLA